MATAVAPADETLGQLAELYLGNILYAIELAALTLDGEGRRDDAAFYRGIARKLADAHGRSKDARAAAEEGGATGKGAPDDGAPHGAY
jgi:hypothetical protein